MKRTPRVLAAVVAATALTFTGVHTADAKPDRAGTHAKAEKSAKAKGGKSAETKLARDVARKVAQLDKAVSEKRLAKLDDDDEAAVVANVTLDKEAIEGVSTRAELRSFRVENYRLVVNVLRKAAKLGAAATEAGNAEATALVDEASAAAVLVTATSSKSELKPARAALAAASALLDPEEAEVEAPEGSDLDESNGDTDGSEGDDTDGSEGDDTDGSEDDLTGTDPVV